MACLVDLPFLCDCCLVDGGVDSTSGIGDGVDEVDGVIVGVLLFSSGLLSCQPLHKKTLFFPRIFLIWFIINICA